MALVKSAVVELEKLEKDIAEVKRGLERNFFSKTAQGKEAVKRLEKWETQISEIKSMLS